MSTTQQDLLFITISQQSSYITPSIHTFLDPYSGNMRYHHIKPDQRYIYALSHLERKYFSGTVRIPVGRLPAPAGTKAGWIERYNHHQYAHCLHDLGLTHEPFVPSEYQGGQVLDAVVEAMWRTKRGWYHLGCESYELELFLEDRKRCAIAPGRSHRDMVDELVGLDEEFRIDFLRLYCKHSPLPCRRAKKPFGELATSTAAGYNL